MKKQQKLFPSIEVRRLVKIPEITPLTTSALVTSGQVKEVGHAIPVSAVLQPAVLSTLSVPTILPLTQRHTEFETTENKPAIKSKRSLGFEIQEKENLSTKDGTVKVSIYYPSGKKTSVIEPEPYKTICRAFVRETDTKETDRIIIQTLCKSNPSQVVIGTAGIIKEESKAVCKRGNQTSLQKKSYDDFFRFNWEQMYNEFEILCPSTLRTVSSIVSDIPPTVTSKPFRHIMVSIAMSLHGRSQEMSVIQYMVGFLLTHGGCTQRDIERLAKLGICVHPRTVHDKLSSWQDKLDREILLIKDSWANGGTAK